jgi:hypothetical protein
MLKFELDGIKITITDTLVSHEYIDPTSRQKRLRFESKKDVEIAFWHFIIPGNLQDFSLIKSTLSYFMQGYWKRSGKEASNINLDTNIMRDCARASTFLLNFSSRQKDKKNYLRVTLNENGLELHKIHLDGQQVLMLDVAIYKALHYLSPTVTTAPGNH